MDPLLDRIATYMGQDPCDIEQAVDHSGVDEIDFAEDPDTVVEEVLAAMDELYGLERV